MSYSLPVSRIMHSTGSGKRQAERRTIPQAMIMCSSCSVVHLNHCFQVWHMALRRASDSDCSAICQWSTGQSLSGARSGGLVSYFPEQTPAPAPAFTTSVTVAGPSDTGAEAAAITGGVSGTGPPLANVSGFPFSATPYQSVGRAEYVPLRPVQSCVPAAGGPASGCSWYTAT